MSSKKDIQPKNAKIGYGKTAAKGGAGGAGTWGSETDPTLETEDYDPNDPNYYEDEGGVPDTKPEPKKANIQIKTVEK
ncbi:uncharacterized protein MONOS_1162 [Monocercomonoides exilis]|uniref:uncharacterized protein n=1 Tax=Monocercomonoides exilis TaxID=2049356 RepID=UPI003559E590|nr:hypothetical protein MONOS_1162 [Monocercomonoides exilis]|eukprot:MONOS_1162.1-p1 / transcript=MONOS_1162.1 / gene=MONOS_1162 / organism=Monocercomonoides_exilis_PA203 / gene_product=unspecified product / transcript_product=unspecified product / location=Mono_scaffold00019:242694-243116(-) / protein_length=78 / sequence_SO=supercontig / SO=protein_coding / is_pseudo=false